AWALDRFERVETIGFDYGQRHRAELDARAVVLDGLRSIKDWARTLGEDRVLNLGVLGEISDTALTKDLEIATAASGLPNTFVPGRNLLFLTFAATVAYRRGLKHVITGVCETDYSGYPDCRDDTIKALQVAINLGMDSRLVLETPLMWIDKAQTWALADALGGAELVELIRADTLTCYRGDVETRNSWGRGCGDCPACELRRTGFERWSERQAR
ncbi:7-cyano-7-deazaguanine synthase QueC, partial [bacterium]